MKFLSHVDEAKSWLKQVSDGRLEMMCILTEPDDSAYGEYYEKMWQTLFNAEKKYCGVKDSQWVLLFLDDVIECMEEKPHFYMNGEVRSELLQNIQVHTEILKRLYNDSGLNECLISNEGQFFGGFDAYDERGNIIAENGERPKVGIVDVLDFFNDFANEEVSENAQEGKIVERCKSNRFVRSLGRRNKSRYGTPLQQVLINAAFAIYNENYSEPDISNLLNGRKSKKN